MTTKRAKVSLYVTKTSQNGIAFIVDRNDREDPVLANPEFPTGMQIRTWCTPGERMNAPEESPFYEPSCSLRSAKLRAMAKALDKVTSRLDAIAAQYGISQDFADTVIRFANAVGAEQIVFDRSILAMMPQSSVVGDTYLVPPGGARFFLEALRDSSLAP